MANIIDQHEVLLHYVLHRQTRYIIDYCLSSHRFYKFIELWPVVGCLTWSKKVSKKE